MSTPLDLAELRRLAEAATPGPWEVVAHEDGTATSIEPNVMWFHEEHDVSGDDLEFIAAARTALPALLDLVDERTRERTALANALALALEDPCPLNPQRILAIRAALPPALSASAPATGDEAKKEEHHG